MAKRGIDMLPLLDVFMVVLFVFATIQEGQLDDTTSQLEQAENARLAAELTAATESARAAVLSAELAVSAQEAARAEEL
jgi:biopolymer transport protein ExbD